MGARIDCMSCNKRVTKRLVSWTIGLDGVRYELDLCKACARRLRQAKDLGLRSYGKELLRILESHHGATGPPSSLRATLPT